MRAYKIGSGPESLTFELDESEARAVDSVRVTLRAQGLEASVLVYESEGFDHLAQFFAEMLNDWEGWDGERAWSSVEGQMELTATHNRHVSLGVRLERRSVESDFWHASACVEIEPGEELSAAASEIGLLFGR